MNLLPVPPPPPEPTLHPIYGKGMTDCTLYHHMSGKNFVLRCGGLLRRTRFFLELMEPRARSPRQKNARK
jgi:hypothetical protein